MPRFKYNGIDLAAAERQVLLGRREFQRMLRIGRRPAIKFEDDIEREVVSDTARANADALGTQVLEIAYGGIGASDDGKCFRVKGNYHAQLRIGAGGSERSLTMESGIGDIGLRKAKRRVTALDAPDVRYRAVRTHCNAWDRLMLGLQIEHTADRVSDWVIDAAGDPGGETDRSRSLGIGD